MVIRRGFLITLLVLVATATLSHAQDEREAARAAAEAAEARLAQYEATLRSQDPAHWTTRQLELYYCYALDVVYLGIERQFSSNKSHMLELDMYQDRGWISKWPLSPLDNWQPLPVLDPADPPVPGGLVWQLCPPQEFSLREYDGGYYTRQVSYELSIYGPTDRTARSAAPQPGNAGWATVAPGTIAMRGMHEPSFYETATEEVDLAQLLRESEEDYKKRAATVEYCRNLPLPEGFDRGQFVYIQGQARNIVSATEKIARLAPGLKAGAMEAGTGDDLEQYLESVSWLMYGAQSVYFHIYGEHARDTQQLLAAGILDGLPGNPLNEWREVRLLDLADGYSPGDAFMQLCDPIYFASGKNGLRPTSFQTGIYGQRAQQGNAQEIEPLEMNADWAQVPEGTQFYLGAFGQSLLQSDYKRAVCFT